MTKENFLGRITYQVLVNITTAVALFLIATAFKSDVQELFDTVFSRKTPPVSTYPIYCTAEPFDGNPEQRELKVNFFIINTSGDSSIEAGLRSKLAAANPDSSRRLKPQIALTIIEPANATFLQADSAAFNKGKGEILVSVDNEARKIAIDIHRIEPRAILKATFLMSDLNFVSSRLDRSVISAVHLDPDDYQDGCYSF